MNEKDVIQLMRRNLKLSSFKMWRKRVSGRKLKHGFPIHKTRFKSPNQKWNLNWLKIAQCVKEIFNGEKNGPKTGRMSYIVLRDVVEEKINPNINYSFRALIQF